MNYNKWLNIFQHGKGKRHEKDVFGSDNRAYAASCRGVRREERHGAEQYTDGKSGGADADSGGDSHNRGSNAHSGGNNTYGGADGTNTHRN